MNRKFGFASLVVGFSLVGTLVYVSAQDRLPEQTPRSEKGFPDFVKGLRRTDGCLGVETAKTDSGKSVIFAWFKDKESVSDWYYSEMHQEVMQRFFANTDVREPLEGVADDVGPLLAVASITFTDKPRFKATPLPISQISIELYQPVTGGLFLGGRFAPKGVNVKGIRDYTPSE
jgi:hypothetical protein